MVVEQEVDREVNKLATESARGCRNIGARICDHVGNNMGCWAIGEVMVVIEMVVEE